ncbi:MAG: ABC transporter substrate-binding protein [Deltaproteobacteria bacterium]|nr:ABC transporter substrate-binding protein [Deltaproteobacteria bacterium]
MKKTIYALVLAGLMLLTTTVAVAGDTVKIGGIYPLSGYLSWLGEYYQKAGELQVEMINEQGGIDGKKVELVIYDDQSSPQEAARAVQRLIFKDQVIAITGTATAPISGAVSSICEKYGVPALISSGYDLKPDKQPFVFNTAHPTYFAIAQPVKYLKSKGKKKLALFMPIGSLGEIGIKNAKRAAKDFDMEIVGIERFDVKAPDVTAQLAKLRALDPDAVLSFCTGEPAALVARNMAQLKFDVPLVVSHGNATPGFLKLTAGLPVTIIVPSGKIMAPDAVSDDDPVKKVLVDFNNRHQAKYGEPANYFSGLVADAVMLTAKGAEISKSTDRAKVKEGIEKIESVPGLGGIYNLSKTDHYGTSIDDMICLTIKDGKWVLLN